MAIRDSQDVALGILQPPTSVRDSQDVTLGVLKPPTAIRDSQDIVFGILNPGTGLRDSQDIIFAIIATVAAVVFSPLVDISQPVRRKRTPVQTDSVFFVSGATTKVFVQPQVFVVT